MGIKAQGARMGSDERRREGLEGVGEDGAALSHTKPSMRQPTSSYSRMEPFKTTEFIGGHAGGWGGAMRGCHFRHCRHWHRGLGIGRDNGDGSDNTFGTPVDLSAFQCSSVPHISTAATGSAWR